MASTLRRFLLLPEDDVLSAIIPPFDLNKSTMSLCPFADAKFKGVPPFDSKFT